MSTQPQYSGHPVAPDADDHIIKHGDSDGWLPATNDTPPDHESQSAPSPLAERRSLAKSKSTASPRSPPSVFKNGTIGRGTRRGLENQSQGIASGGTISRRSTLTARSEGGRPVAAAAFINGAGTTGPGANVELDEEMQNRAMSAEESLTKEQKLRIAKSEALHGKRLSSIIKKEACVEKRALNVAINELAKLQKLQGEAVNKETKSNLAHSKALAVCKQQEEAFLVARKKYEAAQALVNAEVESVEHCKDQSREITERIQQKTCEVEGLRAVYTVDEKEREIKLHQLSGKKPAFKWL